MPEGEKPQPKTPYIIHPGGVSTHQGQGTKPYPEIVFDNVQSDAAAAERVKKSGGPTGSLQ